MNSPFFSAGNFRTFKQILEVLFKSHVALTYDDFKKGQFSKKLVNLFFNYKFIPTYITKEDEMEEIEAKTGNDLIEETHIINKVHHKYIEKETRVNLEDEKDIMYHNINNRVSFKEELVSVIEDLRCENQYLKLQNETLITGNPHAHCEIMNQQLMDELKQLEIAMKKKKRDKQIYSKIEKRDRMQEKTEGFLLLDLLREHDKEELECIDIVEGDDGEDSKTMMENPHNEMIEDSKKIPSLGKYLVVKNVVKH